MGDRVTSWNIVSLEIYNNVPGTKPTQTLSPWLTFNQGHGRLWTWTQEIEHCCCCCCLVTSVVSDSVRPHRWQPTRLPHPWDSPGKNTGVGCHFLLQCMKGKSESEVAQSCPTLSDPMDCTLPGSSIHGIFQARVLEWGAIAFSNRALEKVNETSRKLSNAFKFGIL